MLKNDAVGQVNPGMNSNRRIKNIESSQDSHQAVLNPFGWCDVGKVEE
jgi:hypothetical protein